MDLQIIKSEKQYQSLLDWVDTQFNLGYSPDTKQGKKLQNALLLIKRYEDINYAIPLIA